MGLQIFNAKTDLDLGLLKTIQYAKSLRKNTTKLENEIKDKSTRDSFGSTKKE